MALSGVSLAAVAVVMALLLFNRFSAVLMGAGSKIGGSQMDVSILLGLLADSCTIITAAAAAFVLPAASWLMSR
jgi:hypothetical protein